ncbi:MAG: hypothetical protein HFACDABA_00831 [Anaerolineales bacterium]|nr:hypothetical protein [Anaerolineales bacterium]
MNLRCIYCQTPFTISRMEKLAAIQKLQADGSHHYDAFCPRCRRANPVSIERLQIFTPGWKEGLKTLENEVAEAEKSRVAVASVKSDSKSAPVKAAPGKKRHPTKAAQAAKKKAARPAPKKKPAKAKPSSKPSAGKKKKK